MRALLPALLLLLSPVLFACSNDFSLCKQKFSDAGVASETGLSIPIDGQKRLVVSDTPPAGKIVAADPFLGLYVVADGKPFAFPFSLHGPSGSRVAALDGYMALPGKIRESQQGLNVLGRFEHPLADPALLCDSCCVLKGVATPRGIVERSYIKHLMQAEGNVRYGDAGMRLENDRPGAVVESVDPFFGGAPWRVGDRILAVDGTEVKSGAEVMRSILLSAPGAAHTFTVQRQGSRQKLAVTLQERFGGGLRSDTYLERFGFRFDASLRVTSLTPEAAAGGVAAGDLLVQVDGADVTCDDEVRTAVGMREDAVSLLFERDGFQFFMTLPFDLDAHSH